jgi:LytS/YehU family sensor histidine kinase
MMRYVLSDAQKDKVELEMEVDYVAQYIELQKLRLTDKVAIAYEVTGDTTGQLIAPLVLMPFIENAFKFGISTAAQSLISISIKVDGSSLTLDMSNGLFDKSNLIERSSGIGLANARRRLELLYHQKHKLIIEPNKDNTYFVHLDINLS